MLRTRNTLAKSILASNIIFWRKVFAGKRLQQKPNFFFVYDTYYKNRLTKLQQLFSEQETYRLTIYSERGCLYFSLLEASNNNV